MPYPSEHSARQNPPGKYERFRRENDKFAPGIDAIWGITKAGKAEIQAIRFDVKKWSAAKARKWLEEHDYSTGQFEEATGESKLSEYFTEDMIDRYAPTELSPRMRDHWLQAANDKLAIARQDGHELKDAFAEAIDAANLEVDVANPERKRFGVLSRLWVFRAGEHKRVDEAGQPVVDKFTEDDLDRIVNNFESAPELNVPLVVGHEEQQDLLRKHTGYPAAGWCTKLWREGQELYAAVKSIPRQVADWVNNKSYQKVSAEFYKDYDGQGTTLRRVSLLGATPPVIKDQGVLPVVELSETDATVTYFSEEQIMDPKEIVDALNKALNAHSEAFGKKLDETLLGFVTKFSELMKPPEVDKAKVVEPTKVVEPVRNEKAIRALRTEAVNQFCEFAVKAGKMLPAEIGPALIEYAVSLNDVKKMTFSEDGKEVQKTQYEIWQQTICDRPVLLKFGEQAAAGEIDPDADLDPEERGKKQYFSEHASDLAKAGIVDYDEWAKTIKCSDLGIESVKKQG